MSCTLYMANSWPRNFDIAHSNIYTILSLLERKLVLLIRSPHKTFKIKFVIEYTNENLNTLYNFKTLLYFKIFLSQLHLQ